LLRCPRAIDPKRPLNTSNALPLAFLGSGAVFRAAAVAERTPERAIGAGILLVAQKRIDDGGRCFGREGFLNFP